MTNDNYDEMINEAQIEHNAVDAEFKAQLDSNVEIRIKGKLYAIDLYKGFAELYKITPTQDLFFGKFGTYVQAFDYLVNTTGLNDGVL